MSANGSNPRLDRIERLIEQSERANKEAHARHEREMAEIRDLGRKTREDLRRWAALGVQEARAQRKRQREIDLNITLLAAAQLVTEEKLANLLSSRGNGTNGGRRKAL